MSSRKAHRRQTQENYELPTTPVESTTRHATNARRAATTTKASRKDRQPSSSTTNPRRRKYYPSSPDWDSQITLTQLVPKAKAEASDPTSGLVEYDEDGTGGKSAEVIDLVDDTDENDESSTSRRPATKRESTGGSRLPNSIPTTTFKRRKSSVLISGGPKASKLTRGKNNKCLGRKGADRNKTLTQMDFVRRFIPLPDSDAEDLSLYEEKPPVTEKKNVETKEVITKDELEDSTPRKRRKLNDENVAPSSAIKSKVSSNEKPPMPSVSSAQPKTPQKGRRFEIPSSQTPESPQQKFVASPSIRQVRLFSYEAPFPNTTETKMPERTLQDASERMRDQSIQTNDPKSQPSDFPDEDMIASTINSSSQLLQASTENPTTISEFNAIQPILQPPEPPPPLLPAPKKTIVYDTDEETDYGDLEDDNLPEISIGARVLEEWAEPIDSSLRDHTTQHCDYSDDLPPIPNSGTDLEINGNVLSDTALPSESSVYYRRPAQYTQYPNEPVPIMNTQKIAELFPAIEENGDPASTMQTSVPPTREPAASAPHDHSDALGSGMETPTQDDSVNRSIQVVPESSPVTRSYEAARSVPNTMAPPTRESIVLVESSQLVDKLSRQTDSIDTGKSLRRLFSTRDFLTDSVMESIPAPPWMASQDSIGEPYPENDGRGRS